MCEYVCDKTGCYCFDERFADNCGHLHGPENCSGEISKRCLCEKCNRSIPLEDNGICSNCLMEIQAEEAIAYNKRQVEEMQKGDNTVW